MRLITTAVVAASLLLAGCGPEYVRSTYVPVRIVDFDRPKHFYLDLRTPDGTVHHRVFVSKHCNGWRNTVAVGMEFNARVNHYKTSRGEEFAKFDRGYLRDIFC